MKNKAKEITKYYMNKGYITERKGIGAQGTRMQKIVNKNTKEYYRRLANH